MARKWHQETLITNTQICNRADPEFPRSTSFAKKHNKKGLRQVQAGSAKATRARAEAIKVRRKPKEVKTNTSKGSSYKLSQLAYITHPKIGKCARARIAKGLRHCQRPRPRLKPSPRLWLTL
ncbi:large ribosomal subunit protein eL29-like [Myotis daubentonii]|uniref:large ribosomal subunit protein eL29-like n=1 Tax=Myotis daubentonii TaxID=98922 RepID=UPI002873A151|nr:large ribosomal subunit protein eL29-like [Myotis daubentonii]